jgi:peptide chain release factor 2
LPNKKAQLEELGNKMAMPGFWDNQERAQAVVGQLSALKAMVEPVESLQKEVKDLAELFELAAEENDAGEMAQVEADAKAAERRCRQVELQGLLSRPEDMRNCFFAIHAGAGGTESCDWASMLLRMYTRYFDMNKFKYEELDITPGEEAGIRSIQLRVMGPFAYGKLSCEIGVHRLVRISPFDANARRHTSFVAVDVLPELPETDLTIRRPTSRSCTFGGLGRRRPERQQGFDRGFGSATSRRDFSSNASTSEASQNKRMGLSILQSKINRLNQDKRDEEISKLYGEKGEIAGQSDPQLRAPAVPVGQGPSHRPRDGNVEAVLDGEMSRSSRAICTTG